MRNFFIAVALLVLGVKFGNDYFHSARFQEYANKTKAPWTCEVENFVGQIYVVMSEYGTAKEYFTHTSIRCPDTSLAEEADYQIARCIEGLGDARMASQAYIAFAEKYKTSHRARTALRAAEMIHAS